MSVSGIDGPSTAGESKPGRHKRKIAIGSYRRRRVESAFLGKRLGHKAPKLTPGERKALRKAARLQKAAEEAVQKTEKAEAISTARAEMRRDYSDPFTVVLELARIADKMHPEDYFDQGEYIKAVTAINTLISTLLKEIDKQQERKAEREREEHDQDVQDQKCLEERRKQEKRKEVAALKEIEHANQLREEWLKSIPPSPKA
ncbi:hypothetical protein [Sansalvadorimonas verongulae]|uniref:hypothetical protein n=1 Tax=Sansalvadorimonas verongulae TaxID=2172824 RepID=UPI0012BD6074|nr:hypothetical protein [Sansalvadorimonas verongulae]MTI14390.1 hypothetical protein [Sansalvadorimonas verongulae]